MELSRHILKEFADVSRGVEREDKTQYLRGTIKSSGEAKYVRIDGPESLTPISEIVDVKDGDRVLVTIENHEATILGNLTMPPSAYKEQEAIDKAEDAQGTAGDAVEKAETAQTLAQSAGNKADAALVDATNASAAANQAKQDAAEAITAAGNASKNSTEAKQLATAAGQNAETARQEAALAQNAATAAQGEVTRIEGIVTDVKGDINTALEEVANQAAETEAIKETLSVEYAKKTEVSDVQAALTTEISKKVGELQTTVTQTYAAKNDVVEMEGRLQTQITQTAGEVTSVVGKVEQLESDTTEAQKKVDDALEKSAAAQVAANQAQANATASQAAADAAKANAATATQKATEAAQNAATAAATAAEADKKVAEAKTDLAEAKENLANTMNRVDATEAEIAEAQKKVDTAQAAVTQAQKDAAEATLAANNAQTVANKAQNYATEAQTAATNAQKKADNAALAASNAQASADKAQQDVAALTKRVTSAETAISQNAEQIKLSATKTEEIGNKLDNLKVGSRNLWIINKTTGGIKETLPDNHITGQKECWRIDNGGTIQFLIEPKFSKRMYGKTFTFSAWIKYENVVQGDNGWNRFNIFKHALQYKNSSSGTVTDISFLALGSATGTSDWKKVTYTTAYDRSGFDMLTNSFRFNIEGAKSGTAWVTGIQIEEGTIATDYHLSEEDRQSQIDSTNDNLRNNYYSKTQTDAAIKVAADNVTTTVRKETTEQITNINIGGKNLISGTTKPWSMGYGIPTTTWENGKTILRYGNGNDPIQGSTEILPQNGAFDDFVPENGVTYTQSIYVETDADYSPNNEFYFTWFTLNPSEHIWQDGKIRKIGENLYRIWSTYTWNRPGRNLRAFDTGKLNNVLNFNTSGSYIAFYDPQLEIGEYPTAHGLAEEEIGTKGEVQQAQDDANEANSKADATEERVTVAESTLKQLSDSISMLVTDSNGSSMMTQTSGGWSFNIGAITNAIDNASNNIDSLASSLSQANHTINNLNNLANDLSKKTAYINMTTDDSGSPCIELGKVGNAFKVRITNTSVDFIEGSSKIAYVSNQALFIEKAIVKNELQIGESRGFIWKTRSNGNLGLRWFG